MEIGYLAPPVATNLFIASALFKKPFGQVSRAVLPGLALTCAGLMLFLFVPTCSKGLVNLTEGKPVWQSFPWDGTAVKGAEHTGLDLEKAAKEANAEAAAHKEALNELGDKYYEKTPDARPAPDADPAAPDATPEEKLDDVLEGVNL